MAGGLTISTLNDSSGVLATQNGMSGICKAWVSFTGSTGAIRGSFNVSSVTRNGTGDYSINFTTAMPDANYSVCGSGSANSTGYMILEMNNGVAPTTSVLRVFTVTQNNGAPTVSDSTYSNVQVFR